MSFSNFLFLKKFNNKYVNTKKGSALLIVIIVMMITFMLAAFLLDTSVKNNKQAEEVINNTRLYYEAETGIYDGIKKLIVQNGKVEIKGDNFYNNDSNDLYKYDDLLLFYKAKITEGDDNTKFYIISSSTYDDDKDNARKGYTICATVKVGLDNSSSKIESYVIESKKVYNAYIIDLIDEN